MSLDQRAIPDQIATGGTVSAGARIDGMHVNGLQCPADWTAAVLTFQFSADAVNWSDVYDTNGNAVTWQMASGGRYIAVPPATLPGVEWVRVRSGTPGVPVVQAVARGFVWFARPYV